MISLTTLICPFCQREFQRRTTQVNYDKKRGRSNQFCSLYCRNQFAYAEKKKIQCLHCGKEIERAVSEIENSSSGKFFCSKSCAASMNNVSSPKKKRGKTVCIQCGKTFIHPQYRKNKRCPDCLEKNIDGGDPDTPLSELYCSDGPSKYRKIRSYAKQSLRKEKQICAATGYDKHVETCHIIDLQHFTADTPLKIANDKRNLVLLSPTSHWELDHKLLSLDDIGLGEIFKEYLEEVNSKNLLKDYEKAVKHLKM